jgi:hypothetical protein
MITDTCELLASNLKTSGVSPLPYLIYTLLPNIDPTIYTASLLQKWNKTECNRENKKEEEISFGKQCAILLVEFQGKEKTAVRSKQSK